MTRPSRGTRHYCPNNREGCDSGPYHPERWRCRNCGSWLIVELGRWVVARGEHIVREYDRKTPAETRANRLTHETGALHTVVWVPNNTHEAPTRPRSAQKWRVNLDIPTGTIRALSLHSRALPRVKDSAARKVREHTLWRLQNVPRLPRCTVTLWVAFDDRRPRKPESLSPFASVIYTAVANTVSEQITTRTPLILPPPTPAGAQLLITY